MLDTGDVPHCHTGLLFISNGLSYPIQVIWVSSGLMGPWEATLNLVEKCRLLAVAGKHERLALTVNLCIDSVEAGPGAAVAPGGHSRQLPDTAPGQQSTSNARQCHPQTPMPMFQHSPTLKQRKIGHPVLSILRNKVLSLIVNESRL